MIDFRSYHYFFLHLKDKCNSSPFKFFDIIDKFCDMILPMTPPGIIVVSILLGTCRRSSSWVLPGNSQLPQTRNYRPLAINARPDIFYQDVSDCPDEDECEIDWGAMPGFDDDDDETKEETTKEAEATSVHTERHLIGDELDELEPQEAYVRQVRQSVEKSRTILEMNWEIENCIVDEDTCTDFCSECSGAGKSLCKFCRGTRTISLGNEFRPCLLCANGRVDCSACSGTGNISPWAKTHDQTL